MSDEGPAENIWRELVPAAKKTLAQKMVGHNDKIAVQVAESILDRAGETRKQEERVRTPIVITNSQVAILTAVAEEVERQLEKEQLYEPTAKELENARQRE